MQERRQDAVAQGERRRYEAGHAGGCVKVSDIGLRRAEGAELAALDAAQAECLHEAGEFNGVAKRRRRTMSFDIANGGWIDAGPACAIAMARACASTLGAVNPTLSEPSLLMPTPRITA